MSSSSSFSGDETAPFFGFLGAAAALVFSCMGAAYGTAKSGVGVASMGVMRPELVMKSIVPVVMAGVLGIYGLIIAVIISTGINPKAKSYYLFDGYAHLSSGLACGLVVCPLVWRLASWGCWRQTASPIAQKISHADVMLLLVVAYPDVKAPRLACLGARARRGPLA
ncbi:hypothetical protein MLD38_024802 [Melastoma candidum]|uniref:Uncharacterized protein n=1 Tax=Melastoma candidum TaxID=119954 RepID=A0ACB9NW80_9MYRT|nr:hypothetical protein MLD38_024802 [Melastoma candidum]